MKLSNFFLQKCHLLLVVHRRNLSKLAPRYKHTKIDLIYLFLVFFFFAFSHTYKTATNINALSYKFGTHKGGLGGLEGNICTKFGLNTTDNTRRIINDHIFLQINTNMLSCYKLANLFMGRN